MKKKPGTLDGYLAADVATAITVILFIVFVLGRTTPKYWYGGLVGTVILLGYAMFFSKAEVKNNSATAIQAKDEDDGDVRECRPGQTASGIDGLKVAGTVHKLPDGVHAVVMGDHSLKIRSLWGRLIYRVRGGKLATPPDAAWKPLFGA